METRTREEMQVPLEMPPEVKTAGENTLDSPFFPPYNFLPEPPIGQTHSGAWEIESSEISLEI